MGHSCKSFMERAWPVHVGVNALIITNIIQSKSFYFRFSSYLLENIDYLDFFLDLFFSCMLIRLFSLNRRIIKSILLIIVRILGNLIFVSLYLCMLWMIMLLGWVLSLKGCCLRFQHLSKNYDISIKFNNKTLILICIINITL